MSRGLQLTNERSSFCVLSLDATQSACSILYVDAGLKTIFLCWLYDSIAFEGFQIDVDQSEDCFEEPIRGRESENHFENQPWALYILKAKSFCFDFRVVLASPDQTNPNPITIIWNSFISLDYFSIRYFQCSIDFCSICSRQTVLCSGANSRFFLYRFRIQLWRHQDNFSYHKSKYIILLPTHFGLLRQRKIRRLPPCPIWTVLFGRSMVRISERSVPNNCIGKELQGFLLSLSPTYPVIIPVLKGVPVDFRPDFKNPLLVNTW